MCIAILVERVSIKIRFTRTNEVQRTSNVARQPKHKCPTLRGHGGEAKGGSRERDYPLPSTPKTEARPRL